MPMNLCCYRRHLNPRQRIRCPPGATYGVGTVYGVRVESFFRDVTLTLCSSLDIGQALAAAFPQFARHLPIDGIGLGYSDLEHQRMEVVAWAGSDPPWRASGEGFEMDSEGASYVQFDGTRAPSPLVINRPQDAARGLLALFPGLRRHSVIFLRLVLAEQEVGALIVWAAGHERFEAVHAELLASVTEPLTLAMVNARQHEQLRAQQERLVEDHRALAADVQRALGTEIVGADFGLRAVMERVRKLASSDRPALLFGETGTGKEVIANALHAASPRRAGPFVSLQCGAVPDTLLDSELFGHEKGAFTGALERKRGRFERAHGGSLFLDEIGELTLDAQVKLLRVLQEGRFERIGGSALIEVDVRVIAATHRDLESMVAQGSFREDLWYRLSVLLIELPPLRERRGDIPSLVQHFVHRRAREFGRPAPRVSPDSLARLAAYDWPGNVRELQNVIERALLLSDDRELVVPPLGTSRRRSAASVSDPLLPLDEAMAAHIRRALEHTGGQIAGRGGAAELLRIKPSTLRNRMKKLGVGESSA